MAKVRNERNRSKNLSVAAQVSSRTPAEEKTLRDFNTPGRDASAGNHIDGTQGKGFERGQMPPDIAKDDAKRRGNDLHRQATRQKDHDRSP